MAAAGKTQIWSNIGAHAVSGCFGDLLAGPAPACEALYRIDPALLSPGGAHVANAMSEVLAVFHAATQHYLDESARLLTADEGRPHD